jgi:16S rRNA A1518/A1519 N6-dimethyltransferase RsmA/KsgA/DIM1 with predicted DNA glycosylase/AP lyase activity
MFVFSKAQFSTLLRIDINNKRKRLLDLGAGDGKVTDKMAPYFEDVYVTEQSPSMRWRLQWKGYK